jgi:hypothetical protein
MTTLVRSVVLSAMLGALLTGSVRAGFSYTSGGAQFIAYSPLDTFTPPLSTDLGANSSVDFTGTFSSSPSLTGSVRAVSGSLTGANHGGTYDEMYLSISGVGNYDPRFVIASSTSHLVTGNPLMQATMLYDVSGYLAPGDVAFVTIQGAGGRTK